MSENAKEEGFFGRWSRLKTDAREAPAQPPAEAAPPAVTPQAEDAPPELPPVDSLTIDSDFRGFLHPKVDENLRRTALRKLFSDPHFNVIDGLDVYIDDYSVSEPIPADMLAGMKQAQRILRWAEGRDDEARDEETAPEAEEADSPTAEGSDPALDAPASDNALDAPQTPEPLPQTVAKPA